MNVQVICRSVLTEALCLHFLYFCVHLYSFHSLVYLPFMTFFLLYHNRLDCTLPGENLYTYWRIPVHSFWRFSVCFIILLTEVQCSDGKLYISPVLDCFNGEIIALEMRDNMKKELCIDTIKQLREKYGRLDGTILHSIKKPLSLDFFGIFILYHIV